MVNEQNKHSGQPEKTTFSFKATEEQEPLDVELIDTDEGPAPTPNLPEKIYDNPVIEAQLLSDEDLRAHQEGVQKLKEKYAEQDAEDAEAHAKDKEIADLAKRSTGAALGKILIDDLFSPGWADLGSTKRSQRGKSPETQPQQEDSYKTTANALETAADLLPKHSYIKYVLDRAIKDGGRSPHEKDFQQLDKVRRTLTMWSQQEANAGKDYTPSDALRDYRALYEANGKGDKEYDTDLVKRFRLLESMHRENPDAVKILMGKSLEDINEEKAA
ncbi:MAG TPA: hypothetical protein VFO38_05480 [Candidatus Saccharimonadales bacterium]|nr:hypothetical protein [Candidatus Saccharimonadales bacterium]